MRFRVNAFVACLVSATALFAALPGRSLANGRFPEAQRLLEHPGDPNRLYLAATYGLLLTEDRGRNWTYVCENAFAGGLVEGNPLLDVLPGGKLLGGIYLTLNVSADCGCGWRTVLADSASENVVDITIDGAGNALALVRDVTTSPARLLVSESSDQGETWHQLGELPGDVFDAYTIDVAPSDPTRIYVSATSSAPAGVLLVSRNRASSWEELPISGTSADAAPFIAAVHPSNPDHLFVRTDHWDYDAEFAAKDALITSSDGGRTWSERFVRQAKLFGFALSPDGSTVLLGYGDPVEAAGRSSKVDDYGIYKASTTDFAFEKIYDATVSCLRWTQTGIYACTVQNHPELPSPGMALGFSPDANFTLATANALTPLLDTTQVRGPSGCTASLCAETWSGGSEISPPVCKALGAPCHLRTSQQDISCPLAAAGRDGGVDTPGGRGGNASGDAGDSGDRDGAGCGCRAGGDAPPVIAVVIPAFILVVARRRRRRELA